MLEEIALVADVDEEDEDNPGEKVTLMTLHSAKGLEFPYVFIGGMEERLFPSGLSLDSDDPDALEEERRLCYVGITRAMKKLYLSAASQRMIHGTTNYCENSRFIKEIPSHYLDCEDRGVIGVSGMGTAGNVGGISGKGYGTPLRKDFGNVGYGRPKISSNDYSTNNPYTRMASSNPSANPGFGKAFPMGGNQNAQYEPGDTVKHLKFGKGVVVSVVPAGSDQEITVDFERVGEKKMFASLVKMKKI